MYNMIYWLGSTNIYMVYHDSPAVGLGFLDNSSTISLSMSPVLYSQLQYAWHGLLDSFKWNIVVSAVVEYVTDLSSSVLNLTTYSAMPSYEAMLLNPFVVNLLSLTFIYALDLLLLPLVQHHPNWFHRNIGWFYQALWLFPVMSVSLYLNVRFLYSPFVLIQTVITTRAYGAQLLRNELICSSTVQAHRPSLLIPLQNIWGY